MPHKLLRKGMDFAFGRTDHSEVNTEDTTVSRHLDARNRLTTERNTWTQYQQRGHQVNNFEDLSQWTVSQGEVVAETENVYSGTQSAAVSLADGQSAGSTVRLQLISDSPLGWDEYLPSVAIWLDDPDGYIDVRPVTDGGSFHSYLCRDRPMPASGWQRVDLGKYDGTQVPADLASADGIRIDIRLMSADATAYIDDLRFVPRLNKGYIIMGFDDANDTDYTEGFKTFTKYGLRGYTATNGSDIGESGRLSRDQIAEMHDRGWEFANHTWAHSALEELSPEEQHEDISKTARWLLGEDVEGVSPPHEPLRENAHHIFYPGGGYDANTAGVAQEYATMGFSAGLRPTESLATLPTDPFHIGRGGGDGRQADVQNAVTYAAEERAIAHVYFHRIVDNNASYISSTGLDEICQHVNDLEKAGTLECITLNDYWEMVTSGPSP